MKFLDVVVLAVLAFWGAAACYSIYKHRGCNGCSGCGGGKKTCHKKKL